MAARDGASRPAPRTTANRTTIAGYMAAFMLRPWQCWKNAKAVALLIVLALAIGVGSTTATYVVINGLLLKRCAATSGTNVAFGSGGQPAGDTGRDRGAGRRARRGCRRAQSAALCSHAGLAQRGRDGLGVAGGPGGRSARLGRFGCSLRQVRLRQKPSRATGEESRKHLPAPRRTRLVVWETQLNRGMGAE